MAQSKLTIQVDAEVKRAVDNLEQVNQKMDKVAASSRFTQMATGFSAVGVAVQMAAQAISKAISIGKEWVKLYQVQEQATTKLSAVLKATGNQIGHTTSEFLQMASALQEITTFGDEAILGAQQILVATNKLNKENLPQALELSLDLATALGTDAAGGAQKLAMALQDPEQGLRQLRSANITFSDSEKEKIKALTDSNKLEEAQAIILEKVKKTYGGIAKEVASTDTGKIQQIKNLMGDIKEGLGQSLIDSLSPVFSWLLERLKEVNQKIYDANAEKNFMKDLQEGKAGKYSVDTIREYQAKWREDGDYTDALQNLPITLTQSGQNWELLNTLVNNDESVRLLATMSGSSIESLEHEFIKEYLKQRDLNNLFNQAIVQALAPVAIEGLGISSIFADLENDTGNSSKDFFNKYGTKSNSYLIAQKQAEITATKGMKTSLFGDEYSGNGTVSKYLDEIISTLEKELEDLKPKKEEPPIVKSDLETWIESNGSSSKTFKLNAIDSQIKETYKMLDSTTDSSQITIINEVIQALEEEKKALQTLGEESESFGEKFKKSFNEIALVVQDSFSTIVDFANQGFFNGIQVMEKALDALKNKAIDDNEEEKDSVARKYEMGMISARDYYDSIDALNAAQEEAEAEKVKREEDLQAKINETKRKQFNANKINSIAEATISGAKAVMEHLANPGMAFAMATLSAIQIATIASQQYTPMATGGIVNSPTRALIGEAGPEAIIPLNSNRADAFLPDGRQGGAIYININLNGDVYDSDLLSEKLYDSVSRLQKIGALPNWRTY